MILHDDRKSFYRIANHNPGPHAERPWREFSLSAERVRQYAFRGPGDWFITRHGFTSRTDRRSVSCRQLKSAFCDVDLHSRGCDVGYTAAIVYSTLKAGWRDGRFPEPTAVVASGRGLHIYWSMANSTSIRKSSGDMNNKGTQFFRDVQARVTKAIAEYIEPLFVEAKVDKCVSDDARVSRVPGTVNSSNGVICEVVYYSGIFYGLGELSTALPCPKARKSSDLSDHADKRSQKPFRNGDAKYSRLSAMRIRKIRELQKMRGYGSAGTRELSCFCFYNAAVQVYPSRDDAFAALQAFNSRYHEPISCKEIANIRRSVDKIGFYKLTGEQIAARLALDDCEREMFFRSKRQEDRANARAATQKAKAERNSRMRFLKNLGCSAGAIAHEVGCCSRTVKTALQSAAQPEVGGIPLPEAIRLLLLYGTPPGGTTHDTSDSFFPGGVISRVSARPLHLTNALIMAVSYPP